MLLRISAFLVLAVLGSLVDVPDLLADHKPDGVSAGFGVQLEIRHAARVTDEVALAAADPRLPIEGQLVAHAGGPDSAPPTVTYEASAGGRVQRLKPRRVDHPIVGTVYQIPPQQPEVASVTWVLIYQ